MTALSRLADHLMQSEWRSPDISVQHKPDGSPVTSVDLVLNDTVGSFLDATWPGIWIVSEEDPATFEVPDPDHVAIVDPLDGTENFISGLPIWGISVAVWWNGRHHSSVLAFPELGLCAITGGHEHRFRSRIVGHPSSSSMSSLADRASGPENRILGSAAFNLFCVATGRFASFSNRTGAHAWDILGGLNLARERGCTVLVDDREYSGEFLDPRGRYCFEVRR